MMIVRRTFSVAALILVVIALWSGTSWQPSAAAGQAGDLAAQLRDLSVTCIPADSDKAKDLAKLLYADARARIRAANQRETKAWQQLKTKEDWEKFRDPRIAALRASLGQPVEQPKDLKIRVTRTLDGDGY